MIWDEPEPQGAPQGRPKGQISEDAWTDMVGDLPSFEPRPPFIAALQPTPTDFLGLAWVAVMAVLILVVAAGHIPAYLDGRPLTFHDVVAAMPPFALYAKIVFWVSLAGAVFCADGMLRYWRARVKANSARGYMTYSEVYFAMRPGWISVVFLGLPLLGLLTYWWVA